MDLGQRLKQARLEAGLSQRQLCGEEITRNMLSQIEHGNAQPSVATLQYLAARLGKPVSCFLEEEALLSPNQQVMADARRAEPLAVLEILKDYQAPDPIFDRERYLLEALACLAGAEAALAEDRTGFAATLLRQAKEAGDQTPYYTSVLERQRILLGWQAKLYSAGEGAALLPEQTEEAYLRACAALEADDPGRCGMILDALEHRDLQWHYLRGEACFAQADYTGAIRQYHLAEPWSPRQVYARLEHCYRELEDYQKAYEYACKQRQH